MLVDALRVKILAPHHVVRPLPRGLYNVIIVRILSWQSIEVHDEVACYDFLYPHR